jgi:hypothetical protein
MKWGIQRRARARDWASKRPVGGEVLRRYRFERE